MPRVVFPDFSVDSLRDGARSSGYAQTGLGILRHRRFIHIISDFTAASARVIAAALRGEFSRQATLAFARVFSKRRIGIGDPREPGSHVVGIREWDYGSLSLEV